MMALRALRTPATVSSALRSLRMMAVEKISCAAAAIIERALCCVACTAAMKPSHLRGVGEAAAEMLRARILRQGGRGSLTSHDLRACPSWRCVLSEVAKKHPKKDARGDHWPFHIIEQALWRGAEYRYGFGFGERL